MSFRPALLLVPASASCLFLPPPGGSSPRRFFSRDILVPRWAASNRGPLAERPRSSGDRARAKAVRGATRSSPGLREIAAETAGRGVVRCAGRKLPRGKTRPAMDSGDAGAQCVHARGRTPISGTPARAIERASFEQSSRRALREEPGGYRIGRGSIRSPRAAKRRQRAGTAATTSISIRNSGSASRLTTSSVLAGGAGRPR